MPKRVSAFAALEHGLWIFCLSVRLCDIFVNCSHVVAPGFDAVSNDSGYVGGKDHRLVCGAQRHRQVGVTIEAKQRKGSLVLIIINKLTSCVLFFLMQFRDEAEMEYLKIAQDLEMYGVSYFSITVSVDFCAFI